nr:D-hexose-6-phosphate mutarotase [Planctomycetota bacterium]
LPFLDNTRGLVRTVQEAPLLSIDAPIDRVYTDHAGTCVIHDPLLERRIVVEKEGSQTTVVWNPGPTPAGGDFVDAHDWSHMLCVETANAVTAGIDIEPGRTHRMRTRLRLEAGP